jgi:hypothetical protein
MEEEQSTLLSCSPSVTFTWGKRRSPTKRYGPEEVAWAKEKREMGRRWEDG